MALEKIIKRNVGRPRLFTNDQLSLEKKTLGFARHPLLDQKSTK